VSRRKTQWDHLGDYHRAVRHMEASEAAVILLETLGGRTARRCVVALQKEQQAWLKQMDRAAAGLGAPYGGDRSNGGGK
jgi:uncharacterized protein YecT (DUF1311 family)